MSKKVRKLTSDFLYKLVLEEKEKYEKDVKAAAKKTREVDADEYADTLEKEVNHLAVLKIKEAQARLELKKIQEQREKANKRIQKIRS
jgi:phage shock protein A